MFYAWRQSVKELPYDAVRSQAPLSAEMHGDGTLMYPVRVNRPVIHHFVNHLARHRHE